MTWLRQRGSLLDTVGRYPTDWYLIYSSMDDQTHWYSKLFRPGFQHVQAMRRDGRYWIAVCPYFWGVDIAVVDFTPWDLFPKSTIQHVTRMRSPTNLSALHIGPLTCVTVMKSLLGIRSWRVITPYSLWRFCNG